MTLEVMKKENTCCTYFKIVGTFPTKEIAKRLGIEPDGSCWDIGDLRRDGSYFGFAMFSCCKCEDYTPYVEQMMEKTIEPLLDKISILNKIREDYDVEFYLEVVPHVFVDMINPALAPSLKVMDFCHETRTKIDIDLYLYK